MHPESAENVILLEPVSAAAPVGRRRLRGAAIVAACWLAVLAAAGLTPYSSGSGTHQQLGLPACSFRVRTGLPCPGCGMTTSLAAMAHGQFALAFKAQPFGAVLFLAVLGLAAAGMFELVTGRDLLGRARPRRWWVWVGLAALFGGWAWKLVAAVSRREAAG